MSWELAAGVVAGVLVLGGLVWLGFASGRRERGERATAEAERDQAQGVVDAIEDGRKAREEAERIAGDGTDGWIDRL